MTDKMETTAVYGRIYTQPHLHGGFTVMYVKNTKRVPPQ